MEDLKAWTKGEIISLCGLGLSIIAFVFFNIVNRKSISLFINECPLLSLLVGISILIFWTILISIINNKKIMKYLKSKQMSLSENYLINFYKGKPEIQTIIKDPILFNNKTIEEKQELLKEIQLKEKILSQYHTFNLDKLHFKIKEIYFEITGSELIINLKLFYINDNNVIENIKIEDISIEIIDFDIQESYPKTINIDKGKDYIFENNYIQYKINLANKPKNIDIEGFFIGKESNAFKYSFRPMCIKVIIYKDRNRFKEFTEHLNIKLITNN